MTKVGAVKVEAQWGCDDDDLLTFLEELRQTAGDVQIERYPYGRGGPVEIYFLISLVVSAGGFYLKSFFETLGSEHAKALNRKLLGVLQSGEARQHYRRMFPLRIGAAGTWFHISRPCSTEELTERFRLAAKVVERMENSGQSEPMQIMGEREHYYYWNPRSNSWELMAIGEYGPELPDDAG